MKRATFITWEQLRVGVVILIGLTILTLAVYRLGQAANLFTARYPLVAFLKSGSGIRVGGSVALAGQMVGTIREIEFLPPDADTTRNLRVLIEIDERMQEQIRANSTAQVRTLGLLGDKIIDITPGSPRYQVLAANDTIAVRPSLDYEEVIAQAAEAVDDLVQLTATLNVLSTSVIEGEGTLGQLVTNPRLYNELSQTLAQADAFLTRLTNSQGAFGRMLDDPMLYDQLTSTLAQLDTTLVRMTSQEGSLGRMMADDSLYVSLVGITAGADSLVGLMTTGNGFAAKLLTDQQLYDQLNKLVTDLSAVVAEMRIEPRRFFRGLIDVF
jgi:phospholipid/cholesterol/gamma-HCH transport system substrate-binding protein